MSAAAGLLLSLALTHGLQESPLAGFAPEPLHREAVSAERAQLLLDSWPEADETRRATARELLESARRSGAPALAPPALPALALAWRSLEGAESSPEPQTRELQALADALDLRPVPGFFAARTQGLGELVTVRVRRLWPAPPPGETLVSLWWLPPETQPALEPVRARSEPALPAAFDGEGFEMFIRPPASAPGEWRLVVQLEREDVRVRGVPVLVECLPDPSAAALLAREVLEEPGPSRELARGLLASALGGARLPAGVAPSICLELLRDRLTTRAGTRPRPIDLAFRDPEGRDRWTWAWMPVEPPRVAIVLIAPSYEPSQVVFQGHRGVSWRDTASRLSALLISSPLPRAGAGAEELVERLNRLRDLAHELAGELPVVLVARGDSLEQVQRGLDAGSAGFAGCIVVSPREGEPRLRLAGGTPALFVVPGGPEQAAALDGEAAWIAGERELLLDEPLLPGIASEWLRGILASPREELGER